MPPPGVDKNGKPIKLKFLDAFMGTGPEIERNRKGELRYVIPRVSLLDILSSRRPAFRTHRDATCQYNTRAREFPSLFHTITPSYTPPVPPHKPLLIQSPLSSACFLTIIIEIPVRMGHLLTKIKNKKPAITRDAPASGAAVTPAPVAEPVIDTLAVPTSVETVDSASTNSDALAWTAVQDATLIGMKQLGRAWKEINEALPDKTIGELKQRYKEINVGSKGKEKSKEEGGKAKGGDHGSKKGKGKAKAEKKKAKVEELAETDSDASSDDEDTGKHSSKKKGKGKAKASKKKAKVEEPVYSDSDESLEEASEEEAPKRGIMKKGKGKPKSAMKKPIMIEVPADTDSESSSEEEDEEEEEDSDDQGSKKGKGKAKGQAAKKVTFQEPEEGDSDVSYIDPGYDFFTEFDAPEGYQLPANGRAAMIELEEGEQSPYQLRGRPFFFVQPEDALTQEQVRSIPLTPIVC